jgi:sugar transferase (PEP-CTERM/EpsH1 system associated)
VNVLLLSPWFPWPPFGGALTRVFETARHLAQRHRVTLLAPVSRPPEAEDVATLKTFCADVVAVPVSDQSGAILGRLARGLLRGMPLIQGLHYDANLARHLRRLTSVNAYDVIHVEHSFMAPYMSAVSVRLPAKKILSMHNVESLRFRREMNTATWGPRKLALSGDYHLFGSWEGRAVRGFDAIAAVSPAEQEWVREHAPDAEVALVPNGVDVDYFKTAGNTAIHRSIVFPGLMNYPPNVDAVKWFCGAVLPLVLRRHPDVKFSIVGDKPLSAVRALARRGRVEVTGRVPDARPYMDSAAAVVVPVRSGAGTRLKILEAMAMRRPVVSTTQGAESLDVVHGVNILIADTPEDFANHVCALLSDPGLGDRLGRAGRRLVETTYDWRLCFHQLDALYDGATCPDGRRDLTAVLEAAR